MSEFSVGGHRYSCAKLSAFDQFHVARKLGPVLLWVGNAEKIPDPKKPKKSDEEEARDFAQSICAMSSSLSKEDAEMALNLCLGVVTRDIGESKGFAKLRTPDGAWMYPDIELPQLMEIMWHVLKFNRLPDFFSASHSVAGGTVVGQVLTPPISPAVKIG